MSLERPVPSSPTCIEIEEIILPEEVWMIIWSYLDFKTVQKICTCVSKPWFDMIRSSKLSWEMKLQQSVYDEVIEVTDFNGILSHWNDLRVIHFSSERDFNKFRLCLNAQKSLKKIVVPSTIAFYTKGSNFDRKLWGWASKYWIDPKHILTPVDSVKNAITLEISYENLPEEFAMRQNDWDFTNLDTLEICQDFKYEISSKNLVPMLLRFEKLKKLEICHLLIHMDYLLDFLHYLENMKTLNISVVLSIKSDLDEEASKDFFNKALKVVKEKFPFPDVRVLKLEIFEDNIYERPALSIIYGESGATLNDSKNDNYDSENDTSDSENDTSDPENDTSDSENDMSDSESDTSDSMDESDGSSDFMNHESVENSDTEDMNVQE